MVIIAKISYCKGIWKVSTLEYVIHLSYKGGKKGLEKKGFGELGLHIYYFLMKCGLLSQAQY